jgi:phytanoyl-CoA hydroxylase
MALSEQQKAFYREEGYLILSNLVSLEEVERLRKETSLLFGGHYDVPGIKPLPPTASEEEVLSHYLCVHMPHKVSPVFYQFLFYPPIVEVLRDLIGPNVKAMQSMLFVKPPHFPGQAWHQDEYYIPTMDRSLAGVWVALDDADRENGCLWGIPGSHRGDLLPVIDQPPNKEYDSVGKTCIGFDASSAIPFEVTVGSVIFFNGYLVHESRRNRSDRFRRALVNHYMSAESPLRWLGHEDYRDIVLVCGEDPWAFRGTANLSRPHLRHPG